MTDSNPRNAGSLPQGIDQLLGKLRQRIRAYVWLEGLTLAVIWLGLLFWIGLSIDYLPVLLGSSEMPLGARIVLLLIISATCLYIVYRWIVRRAFVKLRNSSMAVLIERRFPQFHDALLTTVELAGRDRLPEPVDQAMLDHTIQRAARQVDQVDIWRVFNRGPLVRNLAGAILVIVSIVSFSVLARDAMATWTSRLLLLSNDPWPRQAHIEVLGFTDREVKVAEGSDFSIRVRADANRPVPPPEVCTIFYRLDEGERGRVNMSKDGEPRDGMQHYVFAGKPFKGMLESVNFDVVGFDHRVTGYRVQVVESPSIVEVMLNCELPKYTGLLSRQQRWNPGTQLPIGTKIGITATANKPLSNVRIRNLESGDDTLLDFAESQATSFNFQIARMMQHLALEFELLDIDGVESQRPYRLAIGAQEDLAPKVSVLLNGIGSAITPDARIPATGEIEDEYGVDRSWFNIELVDPIQNHSLDFDLQQGMSVDAVLDLREQRLADKNSFSFEAGQKIILSLKANDFFNLGDQRNVGESDRFELEVVTPDELLARLEAHELGLKRRFEHVINEMIQTRDSLVRLSVDLSAPDQSSTDSDEPDDSAEAQDRNWSLRILRVQRARQQGQKSTGEVEGVAAAFDDIRAELINNRVDTQERKVRLQRDIVQPLRQIVDPMFPNWDKILQNLESSVEAKIIDTELAHSAVRQADEILLAMEKVMEKMIELESYNELVDLVRSIIKQQESLLEDTKKQRSEQARRLLED